MTKPDEALRDVLRSLAEMWWKDGRRDAIVDYIADHAHEYDIGLLCVQPEPSARKVARWEYKVQTIRLTELEKLLNVFALDGWELFSTVQDREVFWHILKRPIQEPTS